MFVSAHKEPFLCSSHRRDKSRAFNLDNNKFLPSAMRCCQIYSDLALPPKSPDYWLCLHLTFSHVTCSAFVSCPWRNCQRLPGSGGKSPRQTIKELKGRVNQKAVINFSWQSGGTCRDSPAEKSPSQRWRTKLGYYPRVEKSAVVFEAMLSEGICWWGGEKALAGRAGAVAAARVLGSDTFGHQQSLTFGALRNCWGTCFKHRSKNVTTG